MEVALSSALSTCTPLAYLISSFLGLLLPGDEKTPDPWSGSEALSRWGRETWIHKKKAARGWSNKVKKHSLSFLFVLLQMNSHTKREPFKSQVNDADSWPNGKKHLICHVLYPCAVSNFSCFLVLSIPSTKVK